MKSDNPDPCPAPSMLVQMLRIHAWSDHIDDDSRKFHEWSAETIERYQKRNGSLARKLERAEADNERLKTYLENLLKQKGGAA
jgi:predicted RNase H-like nuclease (RuvC/YqgF family)